MVREFVGGYGADRARPVHGKRDPEWRRPTRTLHGKERWRIGISHCLPTNAKTPPDKGRCFETELRVSRDQALNEDERPIRPARRIWLDLAFAPIEPKTIEQRSSRHLGSTLRSPVSNHS